MQLARDPSPLRFLRLQEVSRVQPERFVGSPARGDVREDRVGRDLSSRHRNGRSDHGDRDPAPVLAPAHDLGLHSPPLRGQVRKLPIFVSPLVGNDQLGEGTADGFRRRVAEQAGELPVHALDPIVHAHESDGLRGLLEELVEQGPLLLEAIRQGGQEGADEQHRGDDADAEDAERRDAHRVRQVRRLAGVAEDDGGHGRVVHDRVGQASRYGGHVTPQPALRAILPDRKHEPEGEGRGHDREHDGEDDVRRERMMVVYPDQPDRPHGRVVQAGDAHSPQ